jgi:hypothetical protein
LALSLRSLRSLRLKAQGGGGSNRRTGVSRHASLVRHVGSAVDCGSAARDRVPWQATCFHAAHNSRPGAYRRQRLPACTHRILRLFAANGLEAVSLVTSFDPMAAPKPIAAKKAQDSPSCNRSFQSASGILRVFVSSCEPGSGSIHFTGGNRDNGGNQVPSSAASVSACKGNWVR